MTDIAHSTLDPDPAAPRKLAVPTPSLVSFHPQVVRAHRNGSLLMNAPAFASVLMAPFYLWQFGLSLTDVALFVIMYWITCGVGLSCGYHRHFSHRAFRAPKAVRWLLAVCASMGAQGSLTYWVAIHRRHHEFEDMEGDPHSPNLHGDGFAERWRGLWHGHFGWTLNYGLPNATHYCPDITREPYLMSVSRNYRKWVLVGLLIPTVAGGLIAGSWVGALGGFIWGGGIRTFIASNSIWALNSICHRFGSRGFETKDQSRNVFWLALPTLGESWHNNHHAFPSSARHGLRWYQLDLNWIFIWSLEKLGLATQVHRAKP